MCIALWSLEHPDYALILGANRDEFLARPTQAAHFHAFGESGDGVLSGIDIRAGGTWLGINRDGRVAVLTNIREDPQRYTTSRGDLANNFLMTHPDSALGDYLADLSGRADAYAGFNLLLFAPSGKGSPASFDAALATNLGGGGRIVYRHLDADERSCGGISNGVDGQGGESWPKVLEARQCLQPILQHQTSRDRGEQDVHLVNSLFQVLSHEHAEPIAAREDLRKTIQVPLINVQGVPNLAGPIPATQSAAQVGQLWYGTRLATVILIRRDGEVLFVERDVYQLGSDGIPHNVSIADGGIRPFAESDDAPERIHRFRIPSS
ncbi:DUF833-domain-containing protein [Exidia glandulosa HHB12029]|uniref:DUF833-domain-containing protein n=1 Tax=Exidia glandulosa HHB12029 TaxID=1314781 RepID=A0A165G559_EXIGL|nr:DUF833-domain-containing protein [Exidia glandulosa HHB12029]